MHFYLYNRGKTEIACLETTSLKELQKMLQDLDNYETKSKFMNFSKAAKHINREKLGKK